MDEARIREELEECGYVNLDSGISVIRRQGAIGNGAGYRISKDDLLQAAVSSIDEVIEEIKELEGATTSATDAK